MMHRTIIISLLLACTTARADGNDVKHFAVSALATIALSRLIDASLGHEYPVASRIGAGALVFLGGALSEFSDRNPDLNDVKMNTLGIGAGVVIDLSL